MKNHRIATSKLKLMNLFIYPNFWLLLFQFSNDCSLRLQVLGPLWLGEHHPSSFYMNRMHTSRSQALTLSQGQSLMSNTMLILMPLWRILVFLPADFVYIGLSIPIEGPCNKCPPLSLNISLYHNIGVVSNLASSFNEKCNCIYATAPKCLLWISPKYV